MRNSGGTGGSRLATLWSACACLLACLALFSCEKPPADQIIRAEKAIEEASRAKGPVYSPAPYEKATRALARARRLVRDRKYKDAAEAAVSATRYAYQSVDLVAAGKEEYIVKSRDVLLEMERSLDTLKQLASGIKNRRARKRVENISGPFVERWTLEIQTLKPRIEKEEPYDTYTAVKESRALFRKELQGVEDSLHKRRTKR